MDKLKLTEEDNQKDELTEQERINLLQKQLKEANKIILEKEQKCASLIHLQTHVDNEVQELTEQLFQVLFLKYLIFKEAHKMVNTANESRQRAERLLAEASLKVDLLQAEVGAFKGAFKARHSSKSIAQRFLNNSCKFFWKLKKISSSLGF